MYNLLISTLISLSSFSPATTGGEDPPTIASFHVEEGVEIMHLEYEKKGSEVYITLILQVDDSVLSVTSASHNYIEATEQLNKVIAVATDK